MIEETPSALRPKARNLHLMLEDPHPGLISWLGLFETAMYDFMCTWFEKTGQDPNNLLNQISERSQ